MPTVEEVLKLTGLTDEQIKAIDAKAVEGFTRVLKDATDAQAAAELAQRAQAEQYDKQIAPALENWANKEASITAERDYYKTLAEKAKDGGFVPAVEPFKPATADPIRGQDGKFVANAGPVPGSPQFMTKQEGYQAVSSASWYISEYMRLHNGQAPPVDIEEVAKEATANHMDFRTFVEKKFDFPAKREAIKTAQQKAHDDKIRQDAVAENDKKWAEKVGTNPNTRVVVDSRFSEIKNAVSKGERPDPLKMTREQRHNMTGSAIQKEIVENSTVQ